jgi:hypothetical protein
MLRSSDVWGNTNEEDDARQYNRCTEAKDDASFVAKIKPFRAFRTAPNDIYFTWDLDFSPLYRHQTVCSGSNLILQRSTLVLVEVCTERTYTQQTRPRIFKTSDNLHLNEISHHFGKPLLYLPGRKTPRSCASCCTSVQSSGVIKSQGCIE